MSSSNSPCAACKFLRRKCTQECVFAPYFPADQPQRFANVHKVFGASNVAKILNEIDVTHREDAVNSLAYEAEARLRDPVYGCVGLISLMQHTLKNLQLNLDDSKKELASLVGPTAMMQMLRNPYFQAQFHPSAAGAASSSHPGGGPSSSNPGAPMAPYNMAQFLGMQPSGSGPGPVVITDLQQQFQQQQIGGGQLIQQPHHHGGQLVIREPQQLQQQHLGAQQQLMIREQQQHLGGQQQLMIREQQQHIVGQQQLMIREQQQQQHIGGQQLLIRDHAQMQAQQAMDAQIAAAMQVREEQEMMRNYEQQQHAQMQAQQHQEMMRFHGDQFGQMGAGPSAGAAAAMSPLLALGSGFDAGNPYHVQQQQLQQEPLLMLQPPQQSESEIVLQIQQQQQEQHQDQQLFHDPHHHLHPPGPGND